MSDVPPPRRPPWPWLALIAALALVGGFAGYRFDWSGKLSGGTMP
jgi:hypothetical protein